MNPLLAILIFFPMLIAVVLTAWVGFLLIEYGLRLPFLFALLTLSLRSGFLVFVLIRAYNRPFLEFSGSDRIDLSVKKRLGTGVLLVTYLVLGIGAILLLNLNSARNWVGLTSFAIGLFICYSGLYSLKQSDILESTVTEQMSDRIEKIKAFLSTHARARKQISVLFCFFGLLLIISYKFLGGVRYFSPLDLLGILFFIFSVGMRLFLSEIFLQKRLLVLENRLRESQLQEPGKA